MLLHSEITTRPHLPNYSTNGSAEHLFALINLCLLIERHKKLILASADPVRSAESKVPRVK
jgi:hypothetical protein